MATYKVRPSKPVAIFGALAGVVILVAGFVMIGTSGKAGWFIWVWLAIGIAIIGFNLWAAFAKKGSIQTITTDGDEPPRRIGTDISRES